jgi:hypothetical protein
MLADAVRLKMPLRIVPRMRDASSREARFTFKHAREIGCIAL